MFPRLHALVKHLKSFGLGGLWLTLGLNSSSRWVSAALLVMAVVHWMNTLLDAVERRRARSDRETPHVGGGINSSINANLLEQPEAARQ